jgi:hypothetical protein
MPLNVQRISRGFYDRMDCIRPLVSFSLAYRRESKVLANKKASVGLALPAAGPGGSDISRSSWHTFLGKKG